jgi:hypothetical protein
VAGRAVKGNRRRLNHDQQIRAALKVLNPPARQRAACRADVENALAIMAKVSITHEVFAAQRTKAHSRAQRTYLVALCRLRAAHRALLDAGGAVPLFLDLDRIERAIHASKPQRFEVLYRAGGTKQTFAVALAYDLLPKWDGKIALTRGRKRGHRGDVITSNTSSTAWWWLGAILYGEDIDLYGHMRRFEPELAPFHIGPRRPTPASK